MEEVEGGLGLSRVLEGKREVAAVFAAGTQMEVVRGRGAEGGVGRGGCVLKPCL